MFLVTVVFVSRYREPKSTATTTNAASMCSGGCFSVVYHETRFLSETNKWLYMPKHQFDWKWINVSMSLSHSVIQLLAYVFNSCSVPKLP